MMGQNQSRRRGFTLIEATLALGIMALFATGALSIMSVVTDDWRQDDTIEHLIAIKHAITGDPRIVSKEARTDFGYVGEMGTLPVSLDDLWIRGAQPVFTFDNSLRLGSGWTGPYIVSPISDSFSDLTLDAWGNTIAYDTTTGVSPTTGQTYRARLTSYGPDASAGGADDLVIEIYDDNTPRLGSGDTVTFPAEIVAGTGVTQQPSHALVSSEVFHVPAISLTTVGTGGTLEIEFRNFDDVASGNGAAVDMTGVTFQLEFSDGSMTVFTAKTAP